MIVLATLGFFPVVFGAFLSIGHFVGIWWEVGASPFMVCLGIWYGLITARSRA